MNCGQCGMRRNRAHRFCPGCGARFEDALPVDAPGQRALRARAENRPAAAPSARLHERKHVTVLFADICGSTEQISRIDPEDAQDFLDRALQLMSRAVDSYGGTVIQLLGDGLLAIFGAPVAQEDHALRACLAAIDMQRHAREAEGDARPVVLRVGVNSGEVIVGASSPLLSSQYRADGSTIHLAARLEQLAHPGTVLISGATMRLAGAQVETTAIGPRAIRGIAGDVEVYELVTSGQRSAAAPLARKREMSAMVGRTEALAEMRRLADQVFAGHGRALGLRGDAGIGKSRLLREFCAGIEGERCRVIRVAAHAYATQVAYDVVSRLVLALIDVPAHLQPAQQRQAARDRIVGWSDARRHVAAAFDVLELGEPDPEWQALTPNQRKRQIAELVYWLVTRCLPAGPLVLVIEDLFLADRESERVFEGLAKRLANMPVLFCVTYRTDFNRRWMDASWFVEYKVQAIGAADMTALAYAMLGRDPSIDALVARLVERADGNPFYLEQMAMTLIDNGTLVGPPQAYVLERTGKEFSIPESIAAVIAARVDRLPAAAKASLEAAAVLGESSTVELIARIRGIGEEQAATHLQLALAAGLLGAPAAGTPARWRFRHGVVQDVVSGALTRPRRSQLHRAAYFALRDHDAAQAIDRAALLVDHAYLGEVWDDAATLATKAMSRSIARSANRDALRMFDIGIEATRRLESEAALPLELGLRLDALGALLPLGRTAAIVPNLERAGLVAEMLGDVRRQAVVALQLATIRWTQGSYGLGLEAAAKAMKAATAADDRGLAMAASQARMMLDHGLGNYRDVVDEGHAVLETYGAELGVLQIMHGWAVIAATNVKSFLADSLWRMDRADEAQHVCDDAYAELSRREHAFSRALVDFSQGELWCALGRHAEAADLFGAALESCRVNDMPTMAPVFLSLMCGAMARAGRAPEALVLIEKAIADQMQLLGGRYNDYYFPINLAIVQSELGEYEHAVDSAAAAVAAASSYGQRGHQADALYELAQIETAAGRFEMAATHFREAAASARQCAMVLVEKRARERLEQLVLSSRAIMKFSAS